MNIMCASFLFWWGLDPNLVGLVDQMLIGDGELCGNCRFLLRFQFSFGALALIFRLFLPERFIWIGCVTCVSATLTGIHSLWLCNNAKQIWRMESLFWLCEAKVLISFLDMCFHVLQHFPTGQEEGFAMLRWTIWERRNAMNHARFVRTLLKNKVKNNSEKSTS